MDGEVHFGQPDRRGVLFHPVEGQALVWVGLHRFDEMRRLHEHAARATGGVDDLATCGFDHIDDGFNDADGREELAVVVGFLVSKLRQEVFVDAPEDIAIGLLQRRVVEDAQDLAQCIIV